MIKTILYIGESYVYLLKNFLYLIHSICTKYENGCVFAKTKSYSIATIALHYIEPCSGNPGGPHPPLFFFC